MIVNRVHEPVPADAAPLPLPDELAAKVRRSAAEATQLAEHDAAGLAHLRQALDEPLVVAVPQLPGDVHDLEGLAHVGRYLFSA